MQVTVTRWIAGLAAMLFACNSLSANAAEERSAALALEDVLGMRTFAFYAPVAPSPDGRLVAYVIRRPASDTSGTSTILPTGAPTIYRATTLLLTDVESGRETELSGGGESANWGASWSPDGTRLAYLSDRDGRVGIWIWDRTSRTSRRVSSEFPRVVPAMTPRWSHDGTRLLLGLAPEDEIYPAPPASRPDADAGGAPTVQLFSSRPGEGGTGTQISGATLPMSDLALVDVATGRAERLVRGLRLVRWEFAPDERHIAFSQIGGENIPGQHVYRYSLHLFDLENREKRLLVPLDEIGGSGRDFAWSPDSRLIAYRIGDRAGSVRILSLDGGSRQAGGAAHPPFHGAPAWSSDGSILAISGDAVWRLPSDGSAARRLAQFPGGQVRTIVTALSSDGSPWFREGGRSILVIVRRGMVNQLQSVSLTGGARLFREQTMEYAAGPGYNMAAVPRARRLFYPAETAQRPEDLWMLDEGISVPRRISDLNPAISRIPMGRMQVIEWQGTDGRTYSGPLVLPSDYVPGRRYPLVVHVYPYEPAADANKFGSNEASNEFVNLQLLATRGYAVLFSGATLRPGDGEPMRSVAAAVLPGVDRVIAMGIADPDRLGVFGQSAGGYSTLALLVQSNRFRAAVSQAGPGNLLSLYGDLRESGYSHGLALDENTFRMPDHPWMARDQYIRNSPWFHLDRIETPLLLIHGMEDSAAIVTQANEMFVGLRRLGRRAEYARYPGEGHVFSSYGNRLDAARRFVGWFDFWLRGIGSDIPGHGTHSVDGSEVPPAPALPR